MLHVRSFYLAGEWVLGDGEPFLSINPATGEPVAKVSATSRAQLSKAVDMARSALANPEWRDINPHQRARLLYSMGEKIQAEIEELAAIQMRDNGKTISECRTQISSAADTFRYYAAVCETHESDVTPARGDYWSMTVFEPMGVIAAITPWNSPATLEAQKLAPILAGGNVVILKSSEVTPLIGLEYARIADACGFPTGVISVVTGSGDVGRMLVDHPGIDMISFTGGGNAGKAIASRAGGLLKPVVLELGGKSPNIVFDDAEFEKAVEGVAGGIFSGAGQSCIAGSRVFVQEAVFDTFIGALKKCAETYVLGRPDDPATKIGPLSSHAHRDSVHRHVEAAVADGAELIVGGQIPATAELSGGAYYPATILLPKDNKSMICQEEVFGPVAAVLPFKEEADLIAMANDSDYGLAAGIWTTDSKRAWRVARKIGAGTVWINTYKQLSIAVPFGGYKHSGLGREKGYQGMKVYMQSKGVYWGN